jgi:hypothetical protein
MDMSHRPTSRRLFLTVCVAALTIALGACSAPLPWPRSPLYEFPESDPGWKGPTNVREAMEAIAGRYAHFDVVAYEDTTTRTPMRTFTVSYGFTEFRIEDGRLYQVDSYCHAEQKLNQKSVTVLFSDEATRAIAPRVQEVQVRFENGRWIVVRPASPTLLGITGDPSLPLSRDPRDPNLVDADGDGKPGVTVRLKMGKLLDGQIYITRREIYSNYLALHSNGNLYGSVTDESEQFVIGASLRILAQQSNPVQYGDPGMNPVILVRVSEDLKECDDLMAQRDRLFPPAPAFR